MIIRVWTATGILNFGELNSTSCPWLMTFHFRVALLSFSSVSLADMLINLLNFCTYMDNMCVKVPHVPPWDPKSFMLWDSKWLTMKTFLTWLCAGEERSSHIKTYGHTPFAKKIKGIGSYAWVHRSNVLWSNVRSFSKSISHASVEQIFHSSWRPPATRRCLKWSEILACILCQKVTSSSPLSADTLWPWQLCNSTSSSVSAIPIAMSWCLKFPLIRRLCHVCFLHGAWTSASPSVLIFAEVEQPHTPHWAIPAHQQETKEKDHCFLPKLSVYAADKG